MMELTESAKAVFTPDLAEAARHLTLLDEEADVFTFQTFDDDKARKKRLTEEAAARGEKYRDPLARVLTGNLEQCAKALVSLNQQGAGVFVTVNATDGKGRKLDNVQRIRTIFQEDDGEGKPLPIEPHFVVESSPGKKHSYVLVDGLSVEDFRIAQEVMVVRYGSDPNAKDPARVLRLAGFYHLKNPAKPHQVRIIAEGGGLPLSRLEVMRLFPPLKAEERQPVKNAGGMNAPMPAEVAAATVDAKVIADLRSALLHMRPDDYTLWVDMGLALKMLGEVGRGLWLEWSSSYKGFNNAEASAKWDSFKPSQTNYKAVFNAAQSQGWVNTAKGRPQQHIPAPAPPAPTDITAERKQAEAFERKIELCEDFDQLCFVLFAEVLNSGLRKPTVEILAKKIAKKTGVSVAALKEGLGESAGPPGIPDKDIPAWVQEMNERHAIVNQQGATRIMTVEECPEFRRTRVSFSSRQDFILRYENREVRQNGGYIDQGTAWLQHPARREFQGVVFAPGQVLAPEVYNLWQGWGREAIPVGKIDKFRDFLRDIICNGDDEAFEYVWCWMVHMVQRPWELPGTSLVIRGPGGTGKNTFVEILGEIVNPVHFVPLTRMEHLTGQFGAHRAGALLLFANEACWGGDKSSEGALKSLVTDKDDLLEAKHQNAIRVKRYARLIVASNNDWPVPRDEQDRRFVILEPSLEQQEKAEYYLAIKAEMEAGGYETLLHELQAAYIEDWRPNQIPMKLRERGWDMKLRSIPGGAAEWYLECLEEGFICHEPGGPEGYGGRIWREVIPTRQVQESYSAWCRRRGYGHPINIKELGGCLQRWGVERKRPGTGEIRPWCYVWGDLETARRKFQEALLIPETWWSD